MLARLIIATLALLCVAQCAWITKDLEVARVRPAVAQVANKIYIAGGQIADGIETKSIEVLNTDTFEFEDINLNLPSARQQFSAVAIGSKIFYSGGLETLSNLVIFNQTSAVFSLLQKAPWVRNVQHIQFLNTSSLCVFGDNSLDIYNALTNTWTSVEEYRNVVKQLFKFGFGVVNNVAYVVGGVFPSNGTLSPNVWTFDLLSHKLTCHNNTILPQYFPHGLKLSFSASAIIMNGGFNGTNYNQIVNILNLNTTKWFSTNCDDLTPALNAISLGAVTDTHAYIAIDAKNAGLNAKIKIVDLANFGVSLTALPLMNGAWTSLVTVGSKVFACGQGVALNTYYIIDGTSFDVGLTLTGALPEMSFELNGKFVLLSPLGDLYTFDPLAIVQSLLSILSTPASAVIDAKVAGQSLAVVYENNKAAIITSAGTVDVSKTLDGDILGIFGDCIVTTTTSYVTSTLDEIKAVTGTIPSSADIVGLFDSLPGTCAVMNILEDVVARITQKIDVYDTIANSWSTLNIPALADKTLTFAGSLDDCLVLTAGNVAYLVNTTTSAIKNQFTLDNVNNAVNAIRAYVQAPEINGTIYVGVGGNLAEVTLTSSDLTVRSDAPHVINHLCLLDDVIYVADVESTKMYLYNLVNNTWSSVSLAGNKLVNYALAAVNDTILIVGGNDGALSAIGGVANDLQTVMVFNPISASLSVLDLDINARSEVTPFSTPDSAVFIGGQNSYGQHQSTVDIYSARASATTEPNVNTNPNTNPNNNPNNTPVASSSVVVLANVVLLLIASLVSF